MIFDSMKKLLTIVGVASAISAAAQYIPSVKPPVQTSDDKYRVTEWTANGRWTASLSPTQAVTAAASKLTNVTVKLPRNTDFTFWVTYTNAIPSPGDNSTRRITVFLDVSPDGILFTETQPFSITVTASAQATNGVDAVAYGTLRYTNTLEAINWVKFSSWTNACTNTTFYIKKIKVGHWY